MTCQSSPFGAWIGRTQRHAPDQITPRLLTQFHVTFGRHCVKADVPPGLHWCLSPPTTSIEALAEDGHAKKGKFLPPIPLPRRMWAGGNLEFLEPLRPGDDVQKTSKIAAVSEKKGRSGTLYFVKVAHEYKAAAGVAIKEIQDIVYREAATEQMVHPEPEPIKTSFDAEAIVEISSVILFRYSAITFNSHRIHYGQPYAQASEFYPDVVVHGPLQATLLLNFATSQADALPSQFKYRGLAPATGTQELRLGIQKNCDQCVLSVRTYSGIKTMEATAVW